ncbi:MAG: hypothetical protein JWR45_1435 [Blastococcus sp.]|jgi:hypothetical protein|nr:hypothetical protein [Blastococcus sp.]
MSIRIADPYGAADVTMPPVPQQPMGQPAPMVVPKFFIKQRITLMVNRYEIRAANPDGTEGQLMAFAEQKRMKLKEEVIFFTDESKSRAVFSFKARQRLDVHAEHDVFDETGRPLGYFSKQFGASLLRSTWNLSAPGIDAVGRERSQFIAILRRIWDLIPYIGDIWVPFVFHFDFVDTATGQPVLTSDRVWSVRDRYEVTVQDSRLDFRVAAALAVALDALQSR